MAGGNFMHRVVSYLVNELLVNSLANSPAIQRFAVRTSTRIEDMSNIALKKRQELAEQMKDLSKNFESNKYRLIYRSLSYHTLNRCPSPLRSTELNEAIQHRRPLNLLLQSVLAQGLGTQSLAMYRGCLFSTTTAATNVGTGNEASKTEGEANSGKEEKSGESNKGEGKPVRGGPVSWLSFVLLVATGVGVIFYYDQEKRKHIEEIYNASKEVKQGPAVGKAAIGGPFNLINHEGKQVTEKDFLGKWTVIYFGFTHCPDICPDELQKLAAAINKIKQKAGIEIVPVFISVDPERDTVEQVAEYVKEFHPKLIGLTGNSDEIRSVARAYRVYYMKTAEEDSDYLVDHSIVMYLMDPDMQFVKFFGKNNDVDSLSDGIVKEIKNYKK
ncbi:Copper chaperone SCO1/SenC [Trema orientale]|uniref:Copper chaperone SCO1/SenC n=1 Tax=Trema orientale TaxID=63057 RepID=A0A2P5F340_TREOI|nr:Copper chaperone SCO1/SenC [Trema orientale]